MAFCFLSHQVYGYLLQQSLETDTGGNGGEDAQWQKQL
jgi:hypothetical protein